MMDDLPTSKLERAQMLESLMVGAATNGPIDSNLYAVLRQEFISDDELGHLLPDFVRSNRNLKNFRTWAQGRADHWHERRQLIAERFNPLMEYLEGSNRLPGDSLVSDNLQSFDADGVHALWEKALQRRMSDPEGAITIARTLIETVCKRILDECSVPYTDKEDLPKLYGLVAQELQLAPDQQSLTAIKAILGGAMGVVNGLGTLRNRLSDAHGRGGRLPVKPSARHAALAVNMAGAMATFLVETYRERTPLTYSPPPT